MRSLLLVTLLVPALAPAATRKELEAELAQLRAEVVRLEAAVGERDAELAALRGELDALRAEDAHARVTAALESAYGLRDAGDVAGAIEVIEGVLPLPAPATDRRRLEVVLQELRLVGTRIPSGLDGHVERWLQGAPVDLGSGRVVVVFWEVWCPHCLREVPRLAARVPALAERGVDVVGVTRVTKSATEESVAAFLDENDVGFPIARDDGEISKAFVVSGIPAAAVVVDGVVRWRGHPGRLDDETLARVVAP